MFQVITPFSILQVLRIDNLLLTIERVIVFRMYIVLQSWVGNSFCKFASAYCNQVFKYGEVKSGLVLFFTYKIPGLSRTFTRTIPGLSRTKFPGLKVKVSTYKNHVPSTQQCYNSLLYVLIIFVTFHHKGAFNL